MLLHEYLYGLLGKKKAGELMAALKSGKTIIISGENGTGKTTLANFLRASGYHAAENFETYNVVLKNPLNSMVPNFKDTISTEQETSGKY